MTEFGWTDQGWAGRQLPGSIRYELHVATFTAEGTFEGVIGRLDHLADLGVDLIELLTVHAGDASRGPDAEGACWPAPDEHHGGPDGLKRLVDAAHARGIGVILQLGPAAPRPPYPRGAAPDGQPAADVLRRLVDAVPRWLREYHLDGLRLAGDTLTDELLEELAAEVEALSAELGRPLSLIAEPDRLDSRLVAPRGSDGYGARWDLDAHRALHGLLAGERPGYPADVVSVERLAAVLAGGFVHAGPGPRGRANGRPVDGVRLPGHPVGAYPQRHRQGGNRALSDRISALSPRLRRVGATLLFTAPFPPLLVMGEEWGADAPWAPERAAVTGAGRRREVAGHGRAATPDPRERPGWPRLDWTELDEPAHRELYELHRRLIALRKSRPELADPRPERTQVRHGDRFLVLRRGRCAVAANLAPRRQRITLPDVVGAVLLATAPGVAVMRDVAELPAESAVIVAAA